MKGKGKRNADNPSRVTWTSVSCRPVLFLSPSSSARQLIWCLSILPIMSIFLLYEAPLYSSDTPYTCTHLPPARTHRHHRRGLVECTECPRWATFLSTGGNDLQGTEQGADGVRLAAAAHVLAHLFFDCSSTRDRLLESCFGLSLALFCVFHAECRVHLALWFASVEKAERWRYDFVVAKREPRIDSTLERPCTNVGGRA
jgi:hypothetical protein